MGHTFYLLLTLLLSAGAVQTQAIDTAIDAGAITQWQDKWTIMPIYTSIPNQGSTGVTLTFYIRISTALPANSIVEISLPDGITTPSSPFRKTLETSLTAGSEIEVEVTGVTLPSSE